MTAKVQIEKRRSGQGWTVSIAGAIDEDADLTPLDSLTGSVRLNLRGIRRFNSLGTRTWIDALRQLARSCRVVYAECSPAVIGQLNMISGFLPGGDVESFYGPMRCGPCDRDVDHLFSTDECFELDGLPPVACPSCRRPMELDDIEDYYLMFLREPTVVRS